MPNKEDDGRWLHSDTDLISGHGVTYYVHVSSTICLFVYLTACILFSILARLKFYAQ